MRWDTDNAFDGLMIVLIILAVVSIVGAVGILVFALPWYGKLLFFSVIGVLSLGFIIGGLRK